MNSHPSLRILLLLFTVATFEHPIIAAETALNQIIHCNLHLSACTQSVSGCRVTLDISPKPVEAMKDLTFKVTLAGKKPSAPPYIDLGMPGMQMGPHRVTLKPMSEGNYEGKGIIVRCPSGNRIWRATVQVPDIGEADFIFDVIY